MIDGRVSSLVEDTRSVSTQDWTEEHVMERGDNLRVASLPGVACWYVKPETTPDEDTEWSGEEVETGRLVVRMVGDDRDFPVDPDEVTLIDRSEFCGQCGQVGCAHDGMER